jgi:hypothetical protein
VSNPTEKGNQVPIVGQAEPAWIRDSEAASLDLNPKSKGKTVPQMIEEICEGEVNCCEHCGAELALWPVKIWADHVMTEHGALVTIQYRTGTAMLCETEFNQAQQAMFGTMFAVRVSMRRRAWKLGYAKEVGAKRIVIPDA